jgi:arylsulfatase A-like enzyme
MKKIIHPLSVCICILALLGCNTLTTAAPTLNVVPSLSSRPTPEATATPQSPEHPNIIFILTDDMSYADLQYMPNTMRLLGQAGMSFDQFFISMALCCPSRSCILRGQYPHNTQITGNIEPEGGFNKVHRLGLEDSTVATWLQQAGYRTALFGKYLNGYPGNQGPTYIPPGWTEWYSPVAGDQYGEFSYTLNENGTPVDYGKGPKDYGTDVYAAKAASFIQRSAQAKQPFFAYISVYAPHSPSTPAPRHATLFQNVSLPRSPSFNEEDVSDKPANISQNAPLDDKQIRQMEHQYRKRLQSLQAVDEMVANLVQQLKTLGQLDNTYIFFTSDNGYHMGEHRLPQGKNTPYEEDIHVPLLVLGPDVEAGAVVSELTGNIDLAPTFAELAGVTAPAFIDGRSLVPFLRGTPVANWRDAFLLERGSQSAETSTNFSPTPISTITLEAPDSALDRIAAPNYVGLRTADYTYVEYATGEIELYDLKVDPYQVQNIAATADPALLAMLHAWLEALRQCAAESCRSAEMQP